MPKTSENVSQIVIDMIVACVKNRFTGDLTITISLEHGGVREVVRNLTEKVKFREKITGSSISRRH